MSNNRRPFTCYFCNKLIENETEVVSNLVISTKGISTDKSFQGAYIFMLKSSYTMSAQMWFVRTQGKFAKTQNGMHQQCEEIR